MDRVKFESKVAAIFSDLDYVSVHSDFVTVHLKGSESVTFDALSQLSELLGTKCIDLESQAGSPGCDTCGYGATSDISICAENVTLEIDE